MGTDINIKKPEDVAGFNPTLSHGEPREKESSSLLIPLEGIEEVGAADYITDLTLHTRLLLELDGERVLARHGTRAVGWLEARRSVEVKGTLQRGGLVRAELHSMGGSDEPSATVEVWL